jgi:hypothetical protein
MNHRIESLKKQLESPREQLLIHRKTLTDLETQKAQYGFGAPTHLNRAIDQEKEEINRLEIEIRQANISLVQEINEIRTHIIATLAEYNHLSSMMSKFENMFLAYVVLPGHQLHLTVQKRKFLEEEYNRIRRAIVQNMYVNEEEIENEVRQALRNAEVAFAYTEGEQSSESLETMSPIAGLETTESEGVIDDKKKEGILKDFKRIVFPKVHADTANVPFEIFDTAHKAYKRKDYLLMEAFIIQYRGDLSQNVADDLLIFSDIVITCSHEYPLVLEKLERRIEKLKQDAMTRELENPEEIQMQMERQNREIRNAIYEEAEKILDLRSRLEDLLQSKRGNEKWQMNL